MTPASLLLRCLGRLVPLLYTHFAWAYDMVAWLVSRGRWTTWQYAAYPLLPDGFLLDIGSGPGHGLAHLLEDGRHVLGLERSPQMLHRARRRLRRKHLPAALLRCSVDAIPLQGNCVDGVLSCFPTDYILEPGTLNELHRVLKRNGLVVIIPYAQPDPSTLWGRAAGWLLQAPQPNETMSTMMKKRFAESGFNTEVQLVEQSGDMVYTIKLEKMAAVEGSRLPHR